MPNVPTFEELGYQGFDLFVWNGIMAPVGTPPAIIAALNREALVCQQKPEVKARLEAGSYEQGMLTPEEFAVLIDKDLRTWTQVVRETGVADQILKRQQWSLPPTNFSPPFNITRASHLVLTARDLAKSRDFYTEVIGLKVSGRDPPPQSICAASRSARTTA